MRCILTSVLAVCVLSSLGIRAAHAQFKTADFEVVNLGAQASDMAYDPHRNLVYVSLPSRNEVAIVSAQTRTIVDRVFVGSSPQGIDISHDGQHLYVALNQAAAVADMDLQTRLVNEIVVGTALGSSLAYDVAEGRPGRVFVTGNPGSGGFSWVAMIKTDAGNEVTRVASNRIIRASPIFQKSAQQDVLYIGEGFSPNSLYKLNILDDTAPIVLEDDHGSLSGTQRLDISPDGTRLYLGSGQVIRADSFLQAGLIGAGIPAVSDDGSKIYVGRQSNIVDIYSATTFLPVGTFNLPSGTASLAKLDLTPGDVGMYALRGDQLVLTVVPEPGCASLVTGIVLLACARRQRSRVATP